MKKQGKAWGETATLFEGNNVEVHRIVGRSGGFCSVHKHQHKYNMFFVESGTLKITEWKDDSGTVDETLLKSMDSCVVPPGNKHKFDVLEDCVAFEIYWVTLNPKDIQREVYGGMK